MEFLFDHWWITTVVPYFAVNIWLLRMFERDEGKIEPEEWQLKVGFVLLALPAGMVFIVWMIVCDLIEWLEALVEGRRRPRINRRRIVRGARWLWRQLVESLILGVIIVPTTIAFTALRRTEPTRFELLAICIVVAVVAGPHVERLMKWRRDP